MFTLNLSVSTCVTFLPYVWVCRSVSVTQFQPTSARLSSLPSGVLLITRRFQTCHFAEHKRCKFKQNNFRVSLFIRPFMFLIAGWTNMAGSGMRYFKTIIFIFIRSLVQFLYVITFSLYSIWKVRPYGNLLGGLLVSQFSMRTAKTVIVRPVGTDTSTEIRIWAREDAIEQVAFAVEVEDYYQVPFPLPKLDLVGVPDLLPGRALIVIYIEK